MARKQRKRRARRTAAPATPDPRTLLEHREMIRNTVIARGVPAVEVDDTVAACLLAAWEAIREERFRVYKRADPAKALERWLRGIAWRLATHERDRAHHRREVLSRNPWGHAHALPVLDPDGQIAARAELLGAMRALPPERSALLIAVAAGMTTAELAARLGVTRRAVQFQIHRARERLLRETMADGKGERRVP